MVYFCLFYLKTIASDSQFFSDSFIQFVLTSERKSNNLLMKIENNETKINECGIFSAMKKRWKFTI